MNMQYIAAAGIIVALVIVGLMLWNQDIPIPGVPWKVEVDVDVNRGFTGNPSVTIGNTRFYRGFSFQPSSYTIYPLMFEADYRVVLETPVDTTTVTFSIGLNSTKTIEITADMPDPPRGLIKVTLYDMGGIVMGTDEKTI